ncbi:MAG: 16S rRNA (cytidine(1402)-2'-O)-methyltransferase [Syntrophobacteraceae bacterium]|nr:16S rRNA (cytidine(1402)-2'-O)-methyltransferase [Syntrophobacteraceae bacterium]
MPSNPDESKEAKEGKLYIVSTPIGNLSDITLRALETLRAADLIAAEDTRRTRKLLSYFDIHKPTVSYHEHNARTRGGDLLDKIASGKNVALVTDAGTPCISDPGRLLVEAALERGIEPVSIPGPTALISALVVSGLPAQPFVFLGFPPSRGAERRRFFQHNAGIEMTLILYESPNRLLKTLNDILESWGDRKAAVARELTKMHEEVFRGQISEALTHFGGEVRGEVALVVEGAAPGAAGKTLSGHGSPGPDLPGAGCPAPPSPDWKQELEALLASAMSAKDAAQQVARRFDLPRRTVYRAVLEMKKSGAGD